MPTSLSGGSTFDSGETSSPTGGGEEMPPLATPAEDAEVIDVNTQSLLASRPTVISGAGPSVAERRENLREKIALSLIGIFAAIVVGMFITIWFARDATEPLLEAMQILVSPLVGLIGAATGFYFGEKFAQDRCD